MADALMTQLLQQAIDSVPPADPATGALIVQLIRRSIEQNDRILQEHSELKAALTAHMGDEAHLVKGLIRAFPSKPDGTPDFEGHETFHTTLIAESRARTVFYQGLRNKLIEKGLWSLLTVLAALVAYWWSGQLRGFH